ncbi:hypothetical protein NE237_019926 [Protea cynaroides]|uniref:AMP-activated protein kinase glycogen-binding domain-containing protein n=1 Tax=Protea cynaroides TaxID=273540 RepID=A0A9Q0K1U3_9MAGN|nr:hypothetical protein NE237_019926 [Protea cynaroides]
MVLFMATSTHFVLSSHLVGQCSNLSFLPFFNHPRGQSPCVSFGFPLAKECGSLVSYCSGRSFVFPVPLFQRNSRYGLVTRRKSWETEGDPALEAEILEFMRKSDNPAVFPTKLDLIGAGRMDLVEAIAKRGGWLASGWDLEEEPVQEQGSISIMAKEGDDGSVYSDSSISLKQRYDSNNGSFSVEGVGVRRSEVVSSSTSPPYLASASNGSPQMEAGVDAGIEGILSRLEKDRSLRFGIGSRAKQSSTSYVRNEEEDDWQPKISADAVIGLERSSRSSYLSTSKEFSGATQGVYIQNRSFLDADGIGSSFKPEMWRKWSTQRAGFSNAEFEAADIVPSESRVGREKDSMDDDEMFTKAKDANDTKYVPKDPVSGDKTNGPNHIRSRLQNLEAELASVRQLLRSRANSLDKGHESSLEELHRLSDDREFQETTIMKTQDILRATRAKLAILQGKMTLTISEAQKLVEEKQRRIDGAQRALLLLRTTCIIWPTPASEVLLSGSFDGWASQRKMERSGGLFSLCLKLYPGRYEIKFIVDGVWKTDPLRPIVHNNGYENNLLIVS